MVSLSPGREKLPALGFARFLAGRGSRNRGRHVGSARSSPLFCPRNKSVGRSSVATQTAMAAATGEVGEPSSPKVTCIGQVRIHSKKSSKAPPKEMRPCGQCFLRALLCSLFPAARKSKGSEKRPFWSRWIGSGRSCRYQRQEPESPRRPPLEFIVIREDEEDRKVLVAEAVTPPPPVAPKNALLLMRCRSAPHNRASSLSAVARGAVSLPPEPEPPTSEALEKGQLEERNSRKKNKTKGTWRELVASELEEDEEEGMGWESHRPLVLARSRSDPARRRRPA